MSDKAFQVIARRWRPRRFVELVGQDHIVRTLRNALDGGRLPHAWLFVGPRGTGKTTTARILAKALNCAGGPKSDFSLDDPVCLAIEQGNCLDVVEIDAASNRSIEDAKKIRDECQFSPTSFPFKVFIIDEVHQLTKDAFNALLKTLEEPPAWVKFILATTEADKVLPTITSRCQRLEFHPIDEEVIVDQLERIVKADGVAADRPALKAIARLAAGGMRDSQSILDQVISFSGRKVTEADVLSIYGLASAKQVEDLAKALSLGDGPAALSLCDVFHEEGRDLIRVLADLQSRVREATLDSVRKGGVSPLLGGPLSTEQLVRLLECLQQGEQGVRHGLSPRANFEVTMLQAIERARARPIDSLIKDIAAAAAGLPREPGQKKIGTPPPAATAAPTQALPDVPVTEDSGDSSPPLDVAAVEDEADQAVRCEAFVFPELEKSVSGVSEQGRTAFPGDKEFQAAVDALPPGLREKLKETLGAEFTALRPVPTGRLRRPS
ncbi:MAG: DNA polymerase III subunit gamma/tau [Verrucomicrobia bacterium]|nr:DNA polymerase III subunit gamma/tau [Verrucomicrobiota bacterium]